MSQQRENIGASLSEPEVFVDRRFQVRHPDGYLLWAIETKPIVRGIDQIAGRSRRVPDTASYMLEDGRDLDPLIEKGAYQIVGSGEIVRAA